MREEGDIGTKKQDRQSQKPAKPEEEWDRSKENCTVAKIHDSASKNVRPTKWMIEPTANWKKTAGYKGEKPGANQPTSTHFCSPKVLNWWTKPFAPKEKTPILTMTTRRVRNDQDYIVWNKPAGPWEEQKMKKGG